MDRVLGEEIAKLAVELGGEGLVVRHHQRRAVHLGDEVGDGEGLAAAGDAEEDLMSVAAPEAAEQFLDRLGLIAGRFVLRDELELRGGSVALGHGKPIRA